MATDTDDSTVDLTRGIYRRIYAGFITGRRISTISMEAEAFFWRLHSVVDDFGNFHADGVLVRAATQGRREFSLQQTENWLIELAESRLILLYKANTGDETFLHISGFESLQPAQRNGRRIQRFPFPTADDVASGGIRGNPGAKSASDKHQHQHQHSETEVKGDSPGNNGLPEVPKSLCTPEFMSAWDDFVEMRRRIKRKLNPISARRMLAKLERWGLKKAILAVNRSADNGWQGVFDPDENRKHHSSATAQVDT